MSLPSLRLAMIIAVMVMAGAVVAGCHDEQQLKERMNGPRAHRLPASPDETRAVPVPALLDTIKPWTQPKAVDTTGWQLAISHLGSTDIWYRVPFAWNVDGRGRATNLAKIVKTEALRTPLTDAKISLAAYASSLAEGKPIYSLTTDDGHIAYLTRRKVSVAPSDPNTESEMFHTAVFDVNGSIFKLEARYDATQTWRFADIADAILGTVQVRAATPGE